MGLDDPLLPAERKKVYGTDTYFVWVEPSGGAGGGGGGLPSYSPADNWGPDQAKGSTTKKKYVNPNTLRSKSVEDQTAMNDNTSVRKEPPLQKFDNLVNKLQIAQQNDRIDKLNEQFVDDYISKPLSIVGFYASYRQYNAVYNNMWQSSDGTWYPLSKKGNGERAIAKANEKYFKRLGTLVGIASISVILTQIQNASSEGEDYGTYVEDLIMVGVGYAGWPGLATSIIFFNSKYSTYYGTNPTNPFVKDNVITNTIYYKK